MDCNSHQDESKYKVEPVGNDARPIRDRPGHPYLTH